MRTALGIFLLALSLSAYGERILIEPLPEVSEAELAKILKPHGAKSVERINGTNIRIIELPARASAKAIAALLAHHPRLQFAEPDVLLPPEATANDRFYGSSWHLQKIQVPVAWDTSTGTDIIIAILDSGVDTAHPDLAIKLVNGWNIYDNNPYVWDVYGHGTKVAGVAAAVTNNTIGVASVARNSKIMPVRVTLTNGSAYLSDMAKGITWAADHGARVANLSFAGAGGYSTINSAATYMRKKGGLVVTAAGNYGRKELFSPNVATITVSGTTLYDAKASWSSYGAFVDIAAPGASIYTTYKGGGYGAPSGTSFAAAVTAGVVALIMAANPALSPAEVEQVLFSTSQDLGAPGYDIYYGHGRVNAAAAVAAANKAKENQ